MEDANLKCYDENNNKEKIDGESQNKNFAAVYGFHQGWRQRNLDVLGGVLIANNCQFLGGLRQEVIF
jgi:hypothetical protein